ncbi:MAG: homoserine dehydrogenase [Endomicrobia bacterium]|nr:homoserine dehydrogenase [Endomicrobiia bacterium]MCX7940824.1 homoserine dehydrogenase [Endomicrobiia bacterium]MDW8056350.1 homoserine dehydrogenase [Elusimicrobiota bacterium]
MKHKNMKTVKVGLIGIGNVGLSLLKLYSKNRRFIEENTGCKVEFKTVCDKDESKQKLLPITTKFVTDYNIVVKDPEIDIVVELIGGIHPAYEIIMESIKHGKHIVTANKAVLSENWDKIFLTANRYNKSVYFEASVAAGIPVIQSLHEGLAGNRILGISGILNGTTNYILTLMSQYRCSYEFAVKRIRNMGIAEADITYDVSGYDTACKLSILSSLAFSSWVKLANIYIEGIEDIELQDIHFAESFGYKIKLLGNACVEGNKYYFEVRKFLVPQNNVFANIHYEDNAILLNSDHCGKVILVGKGAGGFPAASAVMADIISIAKDIVGAVSGRTHYVEYKPTKLKIVSIKDTEGCFYLRFITVDRPGVLAKIANVLGRYKVSIASVYQKEPLVKLRRGVPIILLTHKTREKSLLQALEKIKKLDVVLKPPVYIKVYS